MELAVLLLGWAAGAVFAAVLLAGGDNITLGTRLDGGVVLDDVGDKEVAWDKEVEEQAEVDVG